MGFRRRQTLRDLFGKPATREELLGLFEDARLSLESGTKALERFAKRASATPGYEAIGDEVMMTTLAAAERLVASPDADGIVALAARLDAGALDGEPLAGQHAPPTERSNHGLSLLGRLRKPTTSLERHGALYGALLIVTGFGWLLVVLFR